MDHVNVQLSSILITLLAGMIFGVFFDCYRVFRGKIMGKKGRSASGLNFISDLVFWGMMFILITPIIFWGTWLELRLYVWLLILAGIGLYLAIFSRVTIPWILSLWGILAWGPRKLSMAVWRLKVFSKKVGWWFSK
jgi:spore cortex biosynthesis protein YabQ